MPSAKTNRNKLHYVLSRKFHMTMCITTMPGEANEMDSIQLFTQLLLIVNDLQQISVHRNIYIFVNGTFLEDVPKLLE